MRKKSLKLISVLVISIGLANVALAGDSVSFTVSCTMPQIPGLNSPMLEEVTVRTDTTTAVPLENTNIPQQNMNIQSEIKTQMPAMMQEDIEIKPEIPSSPQDQTLPVVVKTLYCR